jgi:hypothetical protein
VSVVIKKMDVTKANVKRYRDSTGYRVQSIARTAQTTVSTYTETKR